MMCKKFSPGAPQRAQSRSLNRSLISCTALRVPSPPTHPLARNQFTSLGVQTAVRPIRIGRNVLCTMYASTSIAYSPSCPPAPAPAPLVTSISSRPGSGGREYTKLSSHALADATADETYSAPSRLIPTNATAKSTVDIATYTPTAYHPYAFMSVLRRCESEPGGSLPSSGGRWDDEDEDEDEDEDSEERPGVACIARKGAMRSAPVRVRILAADMGEGEVKGSMGLETRGTIARKRGKRGSIRLIVTVVNHQWLLFFYFL